MGFDKLPRSGKISFLVALLFFLASSGVSPAGAEEWSRAYINALPDSAFAVVETTPEGKTLRPLPHHDHTGAVDTPHLKSARARIRQVEWADPSNKARAWEHLDQHWREHLEFLKRGRHGP